MVKNLYDVVRQVQVDLEDYTPQNKHRYLEFALLGYQELQLRVEPKVSVYYFTPNSALLAPLPPDYEYYTKVAVMVCGNTYTLSVNKNIRFPRLECGIETPEQLDTCSGDAAVFNYQGFQWVSHYRAGQYVGEYYSLGGGWNSAGYFRIDHKNRNIVLQNVPSDAQFMMEYVSNGSDGGATLIEQIAFQPIRNYIHCELVNFNRKLSVAEKQHAEARYMKAYNAYKDIAQAVTIEEFIDKMYAGFTPSLKGVSLYGV